MISKIKTLIVCMAVSVFSIKASDNDDARLIMTAKRCV